MSLSQGQRGELVWALTDGHRHWPGVITEFCEEAEEAAEREVREVTAEWYGQKMSCQVSPQLAVRCVQGLSHQI